MGFFDHYPYTNFHNVNLDWVLQAVKSWGALVEQNNQNFIDLHAANEAFKEYVTSYITNLDVQEEINNKLDDMLETGVLTPYLQPYIVTEVESWLDDHITPTTPAIDNTLTVSGAAADAKATGDAINNIAAELENTLFSEEAKNALLTILDNVAFCDVENGKTLINALRSALGMGRYLVLSDLTIAIGYTGLTVVNGNLDYTESASDGMYIINSARFPITTEVLCSAAIYRIFIVYKDNGNGTYNAFATAGTNIYRITTHDGYVSRETIGSVTSSILTMTGTCEGVFTAEFTNGKLILSFVAGGRITFNDANVFGIITYPTVKLTLKDCIVS